MGVKTRIGNAWAALAGPNEPEPRERAETMAPLGHGLQEYLPLWIGNDQGLSTIDDLVERKGLDIYDEMDEKDDMVRASTLLIILGRLSTDWELTPASDDPKDLEVRDFCDFVLGDLDGTSVHRLLKDSMDALRKGFSVSNRVNREPYAPGHSWAGKRGLRTFRHLPQQTITFKTDKHGEIEKNGVWQATPRTVVSSTDPQYFDKFPRDRFVIWSWLKKAGHPFGMSLYRPAWRWYFMKSQLMPWMGGYLEHYGWPRVWAEAPSNAQKGEMEDILEDLRTFQTQQRMVVKKGTSINVEEQKSTTSMDNYKIGIDLANRGIARALLQPSTLLDAEGTGSYALNSGQKGTFEWVLTDIGRTLRDEVMGEQVLRPLVRRNYGDNAATPRWDFEPFSEDDKVAIATMFKTLVDAGVPIGTNLIYESLGLRPPEEDELVVGGGSEMPGEDGPPVPSSDMQPGDEGDQGLADLVYDLDRARCDEERVEVLRGRGKRSGPRARDLAL